MLESAATAQGDLPTAAKQRVVLVQDAFTTFYEPELVLTVRELLEKLGLEVHVAPFMPNGKGAHVKGFIRRFNKQAAKNAKVLKAFAATGATLVTIEPAVGLTYRDEYRHALGKELGFEVMLLQELLARLMPEDERPRRARRLCAIDCSATAPRRRSRRCRNVSGWRSSRAPAWGWTSCRRAAAA